MSDYERTDAQSRSTHVVDVFPTAGSVPFNQLRSYVEFSAPMSEGQAADHVHLFDSTSGRELFDVFLPTTPELWDRDRRRLTMLFDPGRIKQGLAPHLEMSYPLAPGRAVRLVIDKDFLDAAGQPLLQAFERGYEVDADERQHVDPYLWQVLSPVAETRNPLIIDFDRPLDLGLLQHSIRVRAEDGSAIAGQLAIGHEERSWALFPDVPWLAGQYRIEVDHRLEDLAGNSVSRVFDRELSRPEHDPRSEAKTVLALLIERA